MVHSTVVGKADGITLPMTGESSFLLMHMDWSKREPSRCVVKLGTSGTINGFDVDTSHFNGALPH